MTPDRKKQFFERDPAEIFHQHSEFKGTVAYKPPRLHTMHPQSSNAHPFFLSFLMSSQSKQVHLGKHSSGILIRKNRDI